MKKKIFLWFFCFDAFTCDTQKLNQPRWGVVGCYIAHWKGQIKGFKSVPIQLSSISHPFWDPCSTNGHIKCENWLKFYHTTNPAKSLSFQAKWSKTPNRTCIKTQKNAKIRKFLKCEKTQKNAKKRNLRFPWCPAFKHHQQYTRQCTHICIDLRNVKRHYKPSRIEDPPQKV